MTEARGESGTSFFDDSEGATLEPGSAFTEVACEADLWLGVIEWKAPGIGPLVVEGCGGTTT